MKLNSAMESQFELGLSESAVHSQYPPQTPGSDVIEYQGSRFFNEGRDRRLCGQWSIWLKAKLITYFLDI